MRRTHCNTLQHAATRCFTLQHTWAYQGIAYLWDNAENTLQQAATRGNKLQHTAT